MSENSILEKKNPVMPGLTRDAGSERRIARHLLKQAERYRQD
jgi:hypothetical protein